MAAFFATIIVRFAIKTLLNFLLVSFFLFYFFAVVASHFNASPPAGAVFFPGSTNIKLLSQL